MKQEKLFVELSEIANRLKSLIDKNRNKITKPFMPKNIKGKMNLYILEMVNQFGIKDSGEILSGYKNYIDSGLNMFSSCLSLFSMVFKEKNNHQSMDAMFGLSRVVSEAAIKMHYITYTDYRESAKFIIATNISPIVNLYTRAEDEEKQEFAADLFKRALQDSQSLMTKLELPVEADIKEYNKKDRNKILSIANLDMKTIHRKSLVNLKNSFKEIGMSDYNKSAELIYTYYKVANSFLHLTSESSSIDSKNKHYWNALVFINGSLISINLLIKLIPKNKSKKVIKDFNKIKEDFIKLKPEIEKNFR